MQSQLSAPDRGQDSPAIPAYVWKISVLGAMFMLAFMSLGVWQLQRGAEKSALLDLAGRQAAQQSIDAGGFPDAATGFEFRSVRLDGEFLSTRTFLLDNRTRAGRPGREVLQAFRAVGLQRPVLVNRGWLPLEFGRETPAAATRSESPVTIDAEIYSPSPPPLDLVTGVGAGQGAGWPVIVQKVDTQALGEILGERLHPVVVRLRAADPSAFATDWPVSVMSPERHGAYAVQWFSLAGAVGLLVAWCWWSALREGRGRTDDRIEKTDGGHAKRVE